MTIFPVGSAPEPITPYMKIPCEQKSVSIWRGNVSSSFLANDWARLYQVVCLEGTPDLDLDNYRSRSRSCTGK